MQQRGTVGSIVLLTFHIADEVSSDLLCDMVKYSGLRPMQIPAYSDYLPTTTSYYMHGNADHHVEARVRIAAELAVHEDLYLDDNFLAKGISDSTSRSTKYATFSDLYQPSTNLSSTEIHRWFQEETISVVKPGEYMGIWQIHAISSVLGARVKSVYPGMGNVTHDHNHLVVPRSMRFENILHTMCVQ